MKKVFQFFFSPSAKLSVAVLLIAGIVIGLGGFATVNYIWEETSTQEFCVSCHEHKLTEEWLKQNIHGNNRHGVVAECSDCHLPHNFIGKTIRKIKAAREVYGHFVGVIDTPEKYMENKLHMDEREWERMRKSDSAECRYCHDMARANLDEQSRMARRNHFKLLSGDLEEGTTCIDCHEGVAHLPPEPEEEQDYDYDVEL